MSFHFQRPGAACILAIALLLATPATTVRGNRTEVFGTGHAATARPADTTDPPADFTSPATEHDPEVGSFFAGPGAYSVRDGRLRVPPLKADASDYIHWTIHGATLLAVGQVADADPATPTIVNSEAWGEEVISASVTLSEGASATIEAENRIGFSYAYLISGTAIAEANVQLQGNAYDIYRKAHQFHLSEHSGESVKTTSDSRTGTSESEYSKLSATYSTTKKDSGASVGAEAGSTSSDHDELSVNISRRLGDSGGDNGSSPPVLLKDFVTGKTPISRTYTVSSDGSVMLSARAAPGTGETAASVLVRLSEFKILNTLRVWKSVHSTYVTPPPSDPGSCGGVSTPGTGTGGGDGGGDGGGGSGPSGPSGPGSTGGSGGSTGTPTDSNPAGEGPVQTGPGGDDPSPANPDTVPSDPTTDAAPSISSLRAVATPPHGLSGESGTVPGVLTLTSTLPASRELRFAVESIPAGALDIFAPQIKILPGGRGGAVHFEGRIAGDATLRLVLIDEAGEPGPLSIDCPVNCSSVAAHEAPRIWVATGESPWTPGRHRTLRLVGGQMAAPLYVGRLGFRGWVDEATAVGISADDPDALLGPLPATLLIPAGESHVLLPLHTADADGRARLTFAAGEEQVEVTVLLRRQRWADTGRICIPVGALGRIPFRIRYAEGQGRPVTAHLQAQGVVAFGDGEQESGLLAGETAWEFPATAISVGHVDVTLTSPGLDPQVVPVAVVPATVEVIGNRLRLLDMHEATYGLLSVTAPDGMRFSTVALPPEADGRLAVRGVGTGKIVVELEDSAAPAIAEILEVEFALGGPMPAGAMFEIKDGVGRPSTDRPRLPYRIPIR